jgi:predicted transcriptional regulator
MTVIVELDDQLANRAQEMAEGLGMSLNQLIRHYLEDLTTKSSAEEDIAEIRRLSGRGHSKGWKFNRDEIYERP